MKHRPDIIFTLLAIFITAQLVGIVIVDRYLDYDKTSISGEAEFKDLPFNTPRPDVDQSISYVYIMGAIIIGTLLILAIIRYQRMRMWKAWFFLSVTITLTIALSAFMNEFIALPLAIVLAVYKIFKPTFWVHNMTEIFIYGGLAAILTPIINLFSVFMLLILISAYDMYSVWKSKHMITMARSQTQNKLFAGLLVPYQKGKIVAADESSKSQNTEKGKSAILGGGDVGFPLIFTGVVLKTLLMSGVARATAMLESSIIIITSAAALFLLLRFGKKDKFYPAMPFLSLGCLVGYVIVFAINRLV